MALLGFWEINEFVAVIWRILQATVDVDDPPSIQYEKGICFSMNLSIYFSSVHSLFRPTVDLNWRRPLNHVNWYHSLPPTFKQE